MHETRRNAVIRKAQRQNGVREYLHAANPRCRHGRCVVHEARFESEFAYALKEFFDDERAVALALRRTGVDRIGRVRIKGALDQLRADGLKTIAQVPICEGG